MKMCVGKDNVVFMQDMDFNVEAFRNCAMHIAGNNFDFNKKPSVVQNSNNDVYTIQLESSGGTDTNIPYVNMYMNVPSCHYENGNIYVEKLSQELCDERCEHHDSTNKHCQLCKEQGFKVKPHRNIAIFNQYVLDEQECSHHQRTCQNCDNDDGTCGRWLHYPKARCDECRERGWFPADNNDVGQDK